MAHTTRCLSPVCRLAGVACGFTLSVRLFLWQHQVLPFTAQHTRLLVLATGRHAHQQPVQHVFLGACHHGQHDRGRGRAGGVWMTPALAVSACCLALRQRAVRLHAHPANPRTVLAGASVAAPLQLIPLPAPNACYCLPWPWQELRGTFSKDKNEILFTRFGINYNKEPAMYERASLPCAFFFEPFSVCSLPIA